VIEGTDGWRVFDDGAWADLGALKGNVGSQNYAIPADVDLAQLTSVSIWCDRFDVSFGAAALTLA
jgi:Electron transfer DM13